MISQKSIYQTFIERNSLPKNWSKIEALVVKKTYKKGYLLNFNNKIATKIFFLKEGVIRKFFIDTNGKEYSKYIYTDNHLIACFDSLHNNRPSSFSLSCLSPVIIYEIEYAKLLSLIENVPNLKKIYYSLIMHLFIHAEQTLARKIALSTTNQYLHFIKNANTNHKIPLKHIASYLGITPIQLSRIRKKLKEQQLV